MGIEGSKKTNIKKDYHIKDKLGHGAFAIVYRATRKSDKKQFAVKTIQKSRLNKEELAVVRDEVIIMQKVKHKHCVQLFETYDNKYKLHMVMELLTGGELFDRIVAKGSYSEKEAADVVMTISEALQYLHSNGIVHRDLKPGNLIYQDQTPDAVLKITDFGLAKYRAADAADALNTPCGTPGYVAPEVLEGKPYCKEVDLWSLGVILYILLCGFPPFYDESTTALYRQIKRGKYDFPNPYWQNISDDAKNVVKGLLTVNIKERWTIKRLLETPWVTGEASTKSFGSRYTMEMRLTIARKNLRIGIHSVIVINRFVNALRKIIQKAKECKEGEDVLKVIKSSTTRSVNIAKPPTIAKSRRRCCILGCSR